MHNMSRRRDHGAIALTYYILAALLVALALAGPAFVHHPSSAFALMGDAVVSGLSHSRGSKPSCEDNFAAALDGGRGEHAPAAQRHTSRRSMLLGASLQLIGVQAVFGVRGAAASVREFTLDGETFLEVEFSPNEPLGLDLQETQAVTSTFPRVAVKAVRPGSQAETEGITPLLVLVEIQGVTTFMKTPKTIIRFVQEQKRQRDAEGKGLKIIFAKGYCYYPELRQFCD